MPRSRASSVATLLAVTTLIHGDVDVSALIKRSVAATQTDWEAAAHYGYRERDVKGTRVETYELTMIEGSPYHRLVARNDEPLQPEEDQKEKAKFEAEVTRRKQENPEQRAKRLETYQRERDEDHLFLKEMAEAFTYRLLGEDQVDGRSVFVLDATPRPEYRPPNAKAKVLTHMRGKLWIDKAEYQWVKVEAEVTAPVSLYLVAHVGPGSRFVLEQMPVAKDLWLPKRFIMQTRYSVLGVHEKRMEEESYSDYRLLETGAAANLSMQPTGSPSSIVCR
ncbi:MAG: hypothetical protein DMG59_10095 [Acidobacteria bacterium]|nr:MAG: hypothetical protein DMG59_10095 [Acidobacteriota bacterium]